MQDDLRPISCQGANSQGGIALTLIDALDTLLLMGQPQALRASTAWLSENLSLDVDDRVHVFELTIRALGEARGTSPAAGAVHSIEVLTARRTAWLRAKCVGWCQSCCSGARSHHTAVKHRGLGPHMSVKSSSCKPGHPKPSWA